MSKLAVRKNGNFIGKPLIVFAESRNTLCENKTADTIMQYVLCERFCYEGRIPSPLENPHNRLKKLRRLSSVRLYRDQRP